MPHGSRRIPTHANGGPERHMTGIRETTERIEAGVAAYRARKRRRRNAVTPPSSDSDGGGRNYREEDVPQRARDLQQRYPDVRGDAAYDTRSAVEAGYDGRSGDLAELIQAAAENDRIVDLEDGIYEMSSAVEIYWSGRSELVGVVGDGATINYTGTDLEYLFNLDPATTGVIEGVSFDITESTASGHDSDVGIISGEFTDEFWARDVTLRGRRNRYQNLNGDGAKESVGGRSTWLVQMVEPNGTAYVENLTLADGEVNHPDVADDSDGFGGSIPVSMGHVHDGLAVYKDCHVERFTDNGFYMSYDPDKSEAGKSVLWDCYAADVRGGCMRLGSNDTIVGGKTEMHDPPGDRNGKGLDVDSGADVTVIGLTIDAVDFGAEAIQIRTKAKDVTLDRVVLRTGTDPDDSRPVRLSSGPASKDGETYSPWNADITIKDCYWYDQSASRTSPAVEIKRADVTADNWHVRSENAPEVVIDTSGSLTITGESQGSGIYTAADLGMDDPRTFPEYDV